MPDCYGTENTSKTVAEKTNGQGAQHDCSTAQREVVEQILGGENCATRCSIGGGLEMRLVHDETLISQGRQLTVAVMAQTACSLIPNGP